MSYSRRKTERLRIEPDGRYGDDCRWDQCELIDIKEGDIFRSFEPLPDGDWALVVDPGGAVCVALEDAKPLDGYDDGRSWIAVHYVNGFERMSLKS